MDARAGFADCFLETRRGSERRLTQLELLPQHLPQLITRIAMATMSFGLAKLSSHEIVRLVLRRQLLPDAMYNQNQISTWSVVFSCIHLATSHQLF